MRAMMDNSECCACLNVLFIPIKCNDGGMFERWACELCNTQFVKHKWWFEVASRLDYERIIHRAEVKKLHIYIAFLIAMVIIAAITLALT